MTKRPLSPEGFEKIRSTAKRLAKQSAKRLHDVDLAAPDPPKLQLEGIDLVRYMILRRKKMARGELSDDD